MKNILESIQDKEVIITTESTAITMYYGYTKYRDMFIKAKIGVDRNIQKNIVFIDIGYSKTSFIFSTFNYKEFKIKKVKCLPFLGGRNLDFIILKKLMDKFTKKTKVIESMKKRENSNILDPKSTYRLLEAIEKTRKALTVNKDATITVDSLYDEIDLEDEIKKEEFEQDIKNEFLNTFKKELDSFLKDIRKSYKIDDIEMCGELVRTPILQDIVKELSNLDISKKILIDECPSVGAALYGYYKYGNFPINTFEKIYEYNYYKFECEQELIPLKEKDNIEELINYERRNQLYNNLDQDYFEEFEIQLTNKYFKKIDLVKLKLKYKDMNDINNFIDNLVIYEIEVKLQEIIKSNQKIKEDMLLKYQSNHEFIIELIDLIEKKNNKLEKGKNYINILNDYIYNKKEKEIDKNELKTKLQEHQKKDEAYMNFVGRKNQLSIELYKYKTDINNLNNTNYSKEIIEIERALRNPKNVNEIESLQKRVDQLIKKTKDEIEKKKKEDIDKRKEELKKEVNKINENCNDAESKKKINEILSHIVDSENRKEIEDSYSKILIEKSLIDFNNEIKEVFEKKKLNEISYIKNNMKDIEGMIEKIKKEANQITKKNFKSNPLPYIRQQLLLKKIKEEKENQKEKLNEDDLKKRTQFYNNIYKELYEKLDEKEKLMDLIFENYTLEKKRLDCLYLINLLKEKLNDKNNEDKPILKKIDEFKNSLYQCYKEMDVQKEKEEIENIERKINKFIITQKIK